MTSIVAVTNYKGGSGKTTLSFNLLLEAAKIGPALGIDADEDGTLAEVWALRPDDAKVSAAVRAAKGISVTKLLDAAKHVDGLKTIIIDCPPELQDVTATAIGAATLVIVPAKPSFGDLSKAAKTIAEAARFKRRVVSVLTMCPVTTQRDTDAAARSLEKLGAAPIGYMTELASYRRSPAEGLSAGEYEEKYHLPRRAAGEVSAIWTRLHSIL